MAELVLIDSLSPNHVRAVLGLIAGAALGYVARRGRFCTLGAIEDAVYAGDKQRLRAWLLAAAVAIMGAHILELVAGLPLSASIYAGSQMHLGGLIIGGLLFGFGMALFGTCGFGTLLRLGGGDLKALVAFLVLGISAMAAMRGLAAAPRAHVLDPLSVDLPFPQRLTTMLTADPWTTATLGVAAGLGLSALALADRAFRRSGPLVYTALAVGLLVIAGWWVTGVAGSDAFEPARVESFSFVRPVGETVLYAMVASGSRLDFPVATVVGVVLGAAVQARTSGEFRWEAPDDAREMKRHIAGAVMMGFGGVAALGCTIGQGVTGVSTLSIGSLATVLAILGGARVGLWFLVERPIASVR